MKRIQTSIREDHQKYLRDNLLIITGVIDAALEAWIKDHQANGSRNVLKEQLPTFDMGGSNIAERDVK